MVVITKLNDKAVSIDRSGIVKSFTEPFYAHVEDEKTGVIRIYNEVEVYHTMYENLTVDGVSGFANADAAVAAIGQCFASFKSAGGSGSSSGVEVDPVAMAQFNVYFDSNGQLKASALPSQSGIPIELLSAAPTTPETNKMYVFPNNVGTYQMQFWDGTQWNVVGDLGADFNVEDYPTDEELAAALANYVTGSDINTLLANYATTAMLSAKQASTTPGQIGQVLIGGLTPGTFGSIGTDTTITANSANLVTSGAVAAADAELSDRVTALEAGEGGGTITETDPVAMPALQTHMQTDSTRWQDYFVTKGDVFWNTAAIKGYIPDAGSDALEIISNPSPSYSYIVKKGEYKRLVFQYTNANGNFCTVKCATAQVDYSSEGIVEGVTMTNFVDIPIFALDQTVILTNVSIIEIVPYVQEENRLARLDDIPVPDPSQGIELDHQVVDTEYQTQVNTPIDIATGEQLVTADELAAHSQRDLTSIAAAHNDSLAQIASLQSQILNLQASISNKTINGQTAVDILSASQSSYTFTNELGGRLVGQGVRTIGLLGIVLLSTGIVSVNGVEVYNNTSLIGVGDAAILNMDINDGDVITSSGMGNLTVTNYVAG